MIRLARPEDFADIQDIERRAGEVFRALGMDAVADDDPPSEAELSAYVDEDRAWVVSATAGGDLAGYLLVDLIETYAHIEQVTVAPEYARQGFGARLVAHVDRWARSRDLDGLTLTTFTEVPWNAPYYERLGFQRIPRSELSEGLRRVRQHEAELGLDRWPRTAMVRRFPAP